MSTSLLFDSLSFSFSQLPRNHHSIEIRPSPQDGMLMSASATEMPHSLHVKDNMQQLLICNSLLVLVIVET